MTSSLPTLTDAVRDRYGRIARQEDSCCSTSPKGDSERLGYDPAALAGLPSGTDLGLGCGAPLGHLQLQPGEVVLDLGSGAGIDGLLAARSVAPGGRVIGVDLTPEMIDRARRNAATASPPVPVEFRLGRIEQLPVDEGSIDAVTSNCVINLVPDKAAAFREIARVLRPGGRVVISDVVLAQPLPVEIVTSLEAWVGCVAGASLREDYFARVREAGLADLQILKDAPFLIPDLEALPTELRAAAEGLDVTLAEVAGRIRSLTWSARRPG